MGSRKTPEAPALGGPAWLFCLTLGGALACGPSLASVHEGAVRFEHCNRLDLDEHVSKDECGKCWTTWLSEYTYGQPRDRIDYARRRTKALANGDERPLLKFDERNPDERQFYLVVPGPTSVHAPPPPVATVWKDGGGDAGALAKTTGDAPPAESCAEDCRTTWKACGAGCANGHDHSELGHDHDENAHAPKAAADDAANANKAPKNGAPAASNGCSTKCGGDYSSCMKRCFE